MLLCILLFPRIRTSTSRTKSSKNIERREARYFNKTNHLFPRRALIIFAANNFARSRARCGVALVDLEDTKLVEAMLFSSLVRDTEAFKPIAA